METPVRSMSIGWVFFGISRSIFKTGSGNARSAASAFENSASSPAEGSSPFSSKYATSSKFAFCAISWMS